MKNYFTFLIKADVHDKILPEELRQWIVLQVFNLYRVCIAGILLLLCFVHIDGLTFYKISPVLNLVTISFYSVLTLVGVFLTYRHWKTITLQAIIQVFLDITTFSFLMWLNHDFTYGLGILINASIAGGSIITAGRISLLFAAYGSIAVLVQNVFSDPSLLFATKGYPQTGILGATFFATAILGYGLSSRVRMSEALASQRGIDLAKLEKVNELIIQRMRSGVIVIDENDRVRFMNQSAWYLLGIPMRTGPQFIGNLSPELSIHLRNWQKNPAYYTQITQSNIAGHGVISQFTPVGTIKKDKKFATIVFLEDAAQLAQQAQQIKLASLGRLTASIAHEIRNPLSAISHAGQLLAESPQLTPQNLRLTEIILKQSIRMNNVIESILQLSRRKQAAPTVFRVGPWLKEFIQHFKSHIIKPVSISIHIEPENLTFFADHTQLQQVLNNLCENGIAHSGDQDEKLQLEIKASLTKNNEPFIEVIDHGPGIPEDTAEYIFEPFFTTKASGTGLGLYIAKELCEANQAHLSYHRIEHGGSCFRITFHPHIEGNIE